MSEGVTVTVAWAIKPELAETFAETLRGLFPVTRLRKGFRNIRLLRSDVDPSQFLLIEEVETEAQNFLRLCPVPHRDRRYGGAVGDDRRPATDGRLGGGPARRGANLVTAYREWVSRCET